MRRIDQPAATGLALLPDEPVALDDAIAYARADIGVRVLGEDPGTGRLYGKHTTTGHWNTSDDAGLTWTDRTFSPASAYPTGLGMNNPVQLIVANGKMFVFDDAGKLGRATLNTFNAWTSVRGSWPSNTTGRPDVCAHNGSVLLYGNYNGATPWGAEIWRSTDDGATWTRVLNVTTVKHVHAIVFDPADSATVYATLGDFGIGFSDYGLYVSTDAGATWMNLSSNRYGINMVIPDPVAGVPRRIVMEGDGRDQPHLMGYYAANAGTPSATEGLVWPDLHDADGFDWSGTARGICLTSEGNVFWCTTSEAGAVGSRNGVWIARGPWFTTPVLLEDLGTTLTWGFNKTIEAGAYLYNDRYRITRPKFEGQ